MIQLNKKIVKITNQMNQPIRKNIKIKMYNLTIKAQKIIKLTNRLQ